LPALQEQRSLTFEGEQQRDQILNDALSVGTSTETAGPKIALCAKPELATAQINNLRHKLPMKILLGRYLLQRWMSYLMTIANLIGTFAKGHA
jgi:hypothetical protein